MQSLVMAEIVSGFALAVTAFGLTNFRDQSKSTQSLLASCILSIVWTIFDALSYSLNGYGFPDSMMAVINLFSFFMGSVVTIAFTRYIKNAFRERVSINRWFMLAPQIVLHASLFYLLIQIFCGNVFSVKNGFAYVTGGIPIICIAVLVLFTVYVAILAICMRKKIGSRMAVLLSIFGILPIVATAATLVLNVDDYTVVAFNFSLIIICVLLQHNISLQEEVQRNEDLEKNLEIIRSLANTYHSIYYIDMKDFSFVELGTNRNSIRNIIGVRGNALIAMDMMCKFIVVTEMADEMKTFSRLGNLNERLKGKPWISRQFFSVNGLWSEGYFIPVIRDSEGNSLTVIWAVRDITESKKKELDYQASLAHEREKADAANKAKSTFLFNMSHDIRTPMNAIIGFTDLLKKNLDNHAKSMDYIGKIESSSKFLLSLINNVLEMARIESGNSVLNEAPCDLAEQFNNTFFALFSEQMKAKGVNFEKNFNVQHRYIYCDMVKTREIFLNILSNALKYTPSGGTVRMNLKELPSETEGCALMRLSIADTGIGMSKEFLPHLFEEFSRENSTTDSRVEGTGLGMPIVKKLVELLGGTITVESELGKGSTFVVTILYKIAEKSMVERKTTVMPRLEKVYGKRVLLAEDNDLNAEIALEFLGEIGFAVERAHDGFECVNMLENAHPRYYDLILMDVQMPKMDGYQATRSIRAMADLTKKRIPIVAMTANAFDEDKKNAKDAGMNAHLAKPIEISSLMKTISEVLP